MIKVQFKIDGETKTEMWDVDGFTIKECQENLEKWVKKDYPTATDWKIISALQGIS